MMTDRRKKKKKRPRGEEGLGIREGCKKKLSKCGSSEKEPERTAPPRKTF